MWVKGCLAKTTQVILIHAKSYQENVIALACPLSSTKYKGWRIRGRIFMLVENCAQIGRYLFNPVVLSKKQAAETRSKNGNQTLSLSRNPYTCHSLNIYSLATVYQTLCVKEADSKWIFWPLKLIPSSKVQSDQMKHEAKYDDQTVINDRDGNIVQIHYVWLTFQGWLLFRLFWGWKWLI